MVIEVLFGIALVLLALFIYLYKRAQSRIQELLAAKQSLSTKYGKMTEHFMPFLEHYPYDSQKFRFIGTPIDGIQFEDDKIVFMEFKSGNATLTQKQKVIKKLVQEKKIAFEEFRINEPKDS